MEHVPRLLHHDVVVVPVADAQDVGGHAVARAGQREVLHRLLVGRLCGVVALQPLAQGLVLEGAREAVLRLDGTQGGRFGHHLQHAWEEEEEEERECEKQCI